MKSLTAITPARTAIAGLRTATDSLGVQTVKWEKIQALGGAAAALGAELLGVAAVKQKCFS